MTPRLSTIRKIFICLVALGGFILLVLNARPKEWYSNNAPLRLITLSRNKTTADNVPLSHTSEEKAKESTSLKSLEEKHHNATKNGKIVEKPWFMVGGTKKAQPEVRDGKAQKRTAKLFPEEVSDGDDRIVEQLMYVPQDYNPKSANVKVIFTESSWDSQVLNPNLFAKCPVSSCKLTNRPRFFKTADAVLFKDRIGSYRTRPSLKQIWIMYLLECPLHTETMPGGINWTATYRHDSDIVTPYEKFVLYDPEVKFQPKPLYNYAENKTKKVAWFVSNCFARNGRLQYGRELQKYIDVDIYGACGDHVCAKGHQNECFERLQKNYKFYLSFENSNCLDYITEKFYVNGLGFSTIPIVMGAGPQDYERVAPYHSYIHVSEFKSPKELAQYLHRLDQDDELYNRYFLWKQTGEFINTYFWCRLCAMLHDEDLVEKYYTNLNTWWRGPGVCQ